MPESLMESAWSVAVRKFAAAAALALVCAGAQGAARAVIADDVQPEWADWLRRHRIPEHIEEWAPKVCRLISGSDRYVSHATYYLHVMPDEKVTKDTAIAFASGSHIWVTAPWVRERERDGCMNDVMGAYVHELTHAVHGTVGDSWGRPIDLGGTIAVFPPDNGGRPVLESLTEGVADWTRRFFFAPYEEQERRRFDLLNRDIAITDFGQGPDFLDYLNRRFGPKIVPKIMYYCSRNKGDRIRKMWPALTGRTYPQLLADWRGEERIDDPVVRWSFIGGEAPAASAAVRGLSMASGEHLGVWDEWRFEDAGDGTGARLARTGFGRLKNGIEGGDWTLAMRSAVSLDRAVKDARALFALGNVENAGEKELVMATAPGKGLSVVMAVNDGDQHVAGSRRIAGADVMSSGYFTLVATMRGGTNLVVRLNGRPSAEISEGVLRCHGARFGVGLQFGGVFGQVHGGSGLSRSRISSVGGGDSVRFADIRFFRRALKDAEVQKYESLFR